VYARSLPRPYSRPLYSDHTLECDSKVSICGENGLFIYLLRALYGLVVSVLATGPKVRGFDPDRGRWIFKGDKNPEHHFLRRGMNRNVS
jgi:hypothetical protein